MNLKIKDAASINRSNIFKVFGLSPLADQFGQRRDQRVDILFSRYRAQTEADQSRRRRAV